MGAGGAGVNAERVASGEHTVIIGEPDALARQLNARVAAGELVVTESARLPDGRAYARVQVVAGSRPALRTIWPRRRGVVIAVGVAAFAAAVAAAWVIVAAVLWLVAHWALAVGAVVLLGAVWFVLARAGFCPGIHCPGCRHR